MDGIFTSIFVLGFAFAFSKFLVRLIISNGWLPLGYQNRALAFFSFVVLFVYVSSARKRSLDRRVASVDDELRSDLRLSMEMAVKEAEDRISRIKSVCGDVCDVHKPGAAVDADVAHGRLSYVDKTFDCPALFGASSSVHNMPSSRFLSDLPRHLSYDTMTDFMYDKQVPIRLEYRGFDLAPSADWPASKIDAAAERMRAGRFDDVGQEELYRALGDHADLREKRVLIVGNSGRPWLEAAALAQGAFSVVTLNWRGAQTNHSQIKIVHPNSLVHYYNPHSLSSSGPSIGPPPFDAVIAYMSLQSLGLGHLGDGLHPWADLVMMAKAWCVARVNAHLIAAVPNNQEKKDTIVFNSHREYGPLMTSHLFSNWKLKSMADSTGRDEAGRQFPMTISVLQKIKE